MIQILNKNLAYLRTIGEKADQNLIIRLRYDRFNFMLLSLGLTPEAHPYLQCMIAQIFVTSSKIKFSLFKNYWRKSRSKSHHTAEIWSIQFYAFKLSLNI